MKLYEKYRNEEERPDIKGLQEVYEEIDRLSERMPEDMANKVNKYLMQGILAAEEQGFNRGLEYRTALGIKSKEVRWQDDFQMPNVGDTGIPKDAVGIVEKYSKGEKKYFLDGLVVRPTDTILTAFGETHRINTWAKLTGISRTTIRRDISLNGLSMEEVIRKHPHKRMIEIKYPAPDSMVKTYGFDIEEKTKKRGRPKVTKEGKVDIELPRYRLVVK